MTVKTRTVAAVALAGVVGAVIATGAVTTASSSENSSNPPSFSVNAKGQTYGSAQGLAPEEEPDLIFAYSDDGATRGYVLRTDLEKGPATQADSARFVAQNSRPRSIPLYDENDSHIGTFTISAANGRSFTEADTPSGPFSGQLSS